MRLAVYVVRAASALTVLITLFPPPAHAAGELPPNRAALARIEALGDNQGVLLGKAQVVGEFNEVARRYGLHQTGPRSRNYSLKMVWAPERGRALFLGANHAVPHRLNDVWEFDLGAMTWVLLYAPDHSRSYTGLGDDPSDVVFKDGILVTARGGPAVIGHTWSGITYDPVHRQVLFMNIWLTKQDEAVRQLGGDPAERYKGSPLWSFDPAARRWALIRTPQGPGTPLGAMLEYVPDLKGAIWHMNNWQMRGTWLYEPVQRTWTPLPANKEHKDFGSQAPSRELVGYYDPKRKLVIAQQLKGTFHFDVTRRAWSKVRADPAEATDVPVGHDSMAVFYHDAVSGRGLLVQFRDRALWAYDPDSREWTRLEPKGDPMPQGERMLAYVDPQRNVLVVIDDTSVWAYRYARSKPAR